MEVQVLKKRFAKMPDKKGELFILQKMPDKKRRIIHLAKMPDKKRKIIQYSSC